VGTKRWQRARDVANGVGVVMLTVEAIGDAWLSVTSYNPKTISSTKHKICIFLAEFLKKHTLT